MMITDRRVFRGPNLYALYPVIRLTVDLGELEEYPTQRLGDFTRRLLDHMPGLQQHTCSYDAPGGLVRRMTEEDGTWLGHVLEHVAIELQGMAGTVVTYGKTRQYDLPKGQYYVIYEFEEESVGLQAADIGLSLIRHLLPPDRTAHDRSPFDFQAEVDNLARLADRRALGPSTASLVRAAIKRDIPWIRLNDQSLVQFGHGKYQRRIQATVTSETKHIAVDIASDKSLTNEILADLGLPVPRQAIVYEAPEAVGAAERIGYPVVVKPLDANHGRGVSLNLQNAQQVATAFEKAVEHSSTVIVENYVTGNDHRILVVNGKVIACAERLPGHVVGDGIHSIAQLVEIVNLDPRRGVGHEKVLTKLLLDHQAERLIAQAGYTHDTVIPDGLVFALRSTGNLSTGGTSVDKTDVIHYDNRVMAERAVRAIGLDVGGVDFICPDISRSWKEAGGAIVEINAAPGFRMHVAPSEGKARDVAGPVMDMLFPAGTPIRVPIAAITGTNGKTTTTRMVAHIMQLAGYTVGMTTTDGVYINGQLTVAGDMTGPWAAKLVLRDATIDCAVLETARGGLLREGLGWRKCNVGAVLNVAADHLGLRGVNTLEELAKVKEIVAEVAQEWIVLNADDPLVAPMYRRSPGNPFYVTMNPGSDLVRAHIAKGGRAMVLEQGINGQMITYYEGEKNTHLLWTHLIPATLEGHARHNVANSMFAAAVAIGLNVPLETVRQGLRTFTTSFYQTPGRLNIFDEHPFRVILDYAHNPHAMTEVNHLLARMRVHGRKIGVVGVAGDRRDVDIIELGEIAGRTFDRIFAREDDSLRGRAQGEAMELIARGARQAGMPASSITLISSEIDAVDAALREARPGDLLMIFGDNITRSWRQIVFFGKTRQEAERTELVPPPPLMLVAEPTSEIDLHATPAAGVPGHAETED